MDDNHTAADVQRYLNDLAGLGGESPAEPVVRDLLATAARRLNRGLMLLAGQLGDLVGHLHDVQALPEIE